MSRRVTRSKSRGQLLSRFSVTIKRTKSKSKVVAELNQLLASYKNTTPSIVDMKLLRPNQELNDELINSYMELLCKSHNVDCSAGDKVHAMSTFFKSTFHMYGYDRVKRWTKKIDIFSLRLLLIPIHIEITCQDHVGGHWCLAAVHMESKKIEVYNSLALDDEFAEEYDGGLILDYLKKEWAEKRKTAPFRAKQWSIVIPKCRQQRNDTDCGVFTLHFAKMLVTEEKVPPMTSQQLRIAIAKDIVSQRID